MEPYIQLSPSGDYFADTIMMTGLVGSVLLAFYALKEVLKEWWKNRKKEKEDE